MFYSSVISLKGSRNDYNSDGILDIIIEQADRYCLTEQASSHRLTEQVSQHGLVEQASQHCLMEQASSHGLAEQTDGHCLAEQASQYCLTEQSSRHCLMEQASRHCLTESEYQVLYIFTVCVVKLAFHNKFLIGREDWDKLTAGPTPEYVDFFLRQQQEKVLLVRNLCSHVIKAAQDEVWEEYCDITYVYTQFMVRQLALSSLERLIKDVNRCDKRLELKKLLYRRWFKQVV